MIVFLRFLARSDTLTIVVSISEVSTLAYYYVEVLSTSNRLEIKVIHS